MSLNSRAITKLLPVLTVLQWLSAVGDVKSDQKIDIAITKGPNKIRYRKWSLVKVSSTHNMWHN